MSAEVEKNTLLDAIKHCMTECNNKANDNSLPMKAKNVFVTSNMLFSSIGGKIYMRNPASLNSTLILNAINETNQATVATHNAHDQNSVGIAATQLSEAIMACNKVIS